MPGVRLGISIVLPAVILMDEPKLKSRLMGSDWYSRAVAELTVRPARVSRPSKLSRLQQNTASTIGAFVVDLVLFLNDILPHFFYIFFLTIIPKVLLHRS